MRIDEAIKKAGSQEAIRREGWIDKGVYIVPTDTEQCCEVYVNGEPRISRWNPCREDLIADD